MPYDDDVYLVMEYFPYGSLETFFSYDEVFEWITELHCLNMIITTVYGLQFLIENKIVHRDLAPRNILIEIKESVNCKIGDFGMSKFLSENQYVDNTKDTPFPVAYSAPEVILKREYSHESDIFSLGVIIWYIYSLGEKPYQSLIDENESINQIVLNNEHHLKPTKNTPLAVADLIKNCMLYQQNKRIKITSIIQILKYQLEQTLANFEVEEIEKNNSIDKYTQEEEKEEEDLYDDDKNEEYGYSRMKFEDKPFTLEQKNKQMIHELNNLRKKKYGTINLNNNYDLDETVSEYANIQEVRQIQNKRKNKIKNMTMKFPSTNKTKTNVKKQKEVINKKVVDSMQELLQNSEYNSVEQVKQKLQQNEQNKYHPMEDIKLNDN